jgi:hypothetical protein
MAHGDVITARPLGLTDCDDAAVLVDELLARQAISSLDHRLLREIIRAAAESPACLSGSVRSGVPASHASRAAACGRPSRRAFAASFWSRLLNARPDVSSGGATTSASAAIACRRASFSCSSWRTRAASGAPPSSSYPTRVAPLDPRPPLAESA